MKAKCKRDGTKFKMIPGSLQADWKTKYPEEPDIYVQCPTCKRHYFLKKCGDWYADRILILIPENLQEAEKIRDELKIRMSKSTHLEEMDWLHSRYIEACNDCESF